MTTADDPARSPVAVAIPCLNEAAAIAEVIDRWRVVLPEAEIVVFDNASTDATGAIARGLGVRVVDVPEPGKGNAVRAIFRALADRPAVILVDGDGTYPADAIGPMLATVLADQADMVVGARRPVDAPGAMTAVRGAGNVLIRSAFAVLIGAGPGDLLSGYRVFGPRFLREVRPQSSGFEIEAELSIEAVARGMRVAEVAVAYHPRIAGTVSKLRASRDGARIVGTIVRGSLRHRPLRALGLPGLVIAATATAWLVGSEAAWVVIGTAVGAVAAWARVGRPRVSPPRSTPGP